MLSCIFVMSTLVFSHPDWARPISVEATASPAREIDLGIYIGGYQTITGAWKFGVLLPGVDMAAFAPVARECVAQPHDTKDVRDAT